MKNFLEKRAGQTVKLIIDMNDQRQPTHYYEGQLVILLEDSIIVRDKVLGEVAVNPDRIAAIQISEPGA